MPDQEVQADEPKPIIDDREVLEETFEDLLRMPEEPEEDVEETASMTDEEIKAHFRQSLIRFDAAWDEAKHPREKGKFAPKGQGDGGAGPEEPNGEKPAKKEEPPDDEKKAEPSAKPKVKRDLSKMPGVIYSKEDLERRVAVMPGGGKAVPERDWIEHLEGMPRETIDEHKLPDGTWKPERQKLHQKIVSHFFEGMAPVPEDQAPHVTFMVGGTASGKSTLADKIKAAGNHVVIDPDAIKGQKLKDGSFLGLPEYEKAVKASAKDAAFMAHEESSELAKTVRAKAFEGRYNMLVDGTGSKYDSYAPLMQKMKDAGYVVDLIGVDLDYETAVKRAKGRAQKTGRYVKESIMAGVYDTAYPNFPKFTGLVDRWALYDNRGPIPRRVWSGGADTPEEVVDADFVNEFKSRKPKGAGAPKT